ncbi:MAG: ATP-dependent zinc metalloprotease FtsH [Clostridia bacterium]|nr:ATP-dependent zinc metalloprotease FtsH [Clostridia bacterium]
MNKKSKIILWVVILVLIVAIIVIFVAFSLSGGATQIGISDFQQYVENAQYYDLDGTTQTAKDFTLQKDEETGEDVYKSSDGTVLLDGYTPSTSSDGRAIIVYKDTETEINVIWEVDISAYEFNGYTASGTNAWYAYGPSLFSTDGMDIISTWNAYGVTVVMSNPNSGNWWSIAVTVISLILIIVIFVILIRSSMGGGRVMNFAKSKAKATTNVKVRFTDVAGAEEEKVELAEIVEFLRSPKKFSDLGARVPKGVLLVGPPGTGKTLFAKAVAGEANVPFFSVSGSDFVEMYVGVGASRVRDLFDMAKKNQPCIIFVDEIDAVGRHRGAGLGGGNDEREQTLNQILVQMDGFEQNDGIIVMAATNRADILDPALLRPGRFDRQIYVNLPDVKGREAILKVHARNKPMAPDVNFKIVARITSGFSGADLANLLNEAAILAARANKKFIGNPELYEAVNKVLMGPAKKSRVVTESDKRITAYHEAGHAIIARLCPDCDPVQEVSIIPRGNAAGYTMTRPDNDDNHMTKNKLLDFICMALGGRIAEELVIKDITTGASNDLERITDIAKKMVTEWGMTDSLGLVTYGSNSQTVFLGKDMETHNTYSEETARLIDEEMHNIINGQHERGTKLLSENRSILDNMARVLIEKETIYTEEVDLLMEGKSYAEVIQYMDEQDAKRADNPFKRYEN